MGLRPVCDFFFAKHALVIGVVGPWWLMGALKIEMLFVLIVAALMERRIDTSIGILLAPELEALQQAPQLRRNVDKLGAIVFAEAAFAIGSLYTRPAYNIVQAIRALLRLHVLGQERETDAAGEQLLQRRDLIVDSTILLNLLITRRLGCARYF